MLILTRRNGESLVTISRGPSDDVIRITVLGIKGGQVRLGIDAPSDIEVWREEIYQKILRSREGGPDR